MYSINHQAESCVDCQGKRTSGPNGWFVCQDCYQIFCHEHCIIHRHEAKEEQNLPERYNRQIHLDQIAAWERKAIERIQRQANEARRPLIAPPTPISPPEPVSMLIDKLRSPSLTKLLTISSSMEKESQKIDPYELLSDETLDELIGDGSLTCPPNEPSMLGRISFASQCPYLTGIHHLRLSIDHFQSPSSWAFVGIVSNGTRSEQSGQALYFNRSSFGWHLGRQSIVYDRHTSTSHGYDGRNLRSGDIMQIKIHCEEKLIRIKNERTQQSHAIPIDMQRCPLPWFFAVNFNYEAKDSMRLLP